MVVRGLFWRAVNTVLNSTFGVDEKKKAETLFGELATKMDALPELHVRLFANIPRPSNSSYPDRKSVV